LLYTGQISEGRAHLDRAIALYDPHKHRLLTTRFGHDIRAAALCFRSWTQWLLGYPDAALADADRSLVDAREIGQTAVLMFSLTTVAVTNILCGKYAAATALADELVELAEEKNTVLFKAWGTIHRGCVSALNGEAAEAIRIIPLGLSASRSTGSRYLVPYFLSHLAWTYAEIGRCDEASR
jgi:hypothetical protein